MTLLSELIDIPTQVHKGDFVLRLRPVPIVRPWRAILWPRIRTRRASKITQSRCGASLPKTPAEPQEAQPLSRSGFLG